MKTKQNKKLTIEDRIIEQAAERMITDAHGKGMKGVMKSIFKAGVNWQKSRLKKKIN